MALLDAAPAKKGGKGGRGGDIDDMDEMDDMGLMEPAEGGGKTKGVNLGVGIESDAIIGSCSLLFLRLMREKMPSFCRMFGLSVSLNEASERGSKVPTLFLTNGLKMSILRPDMAKDIGGDVGVTVMA